MDGSLIEAPVLFLSWEDIVNNRIYTVHGRSQIKWTDYKMDVDVSSVVGAGHPAEEIRESLEPVVTELGGDPDSILKADVLVGMSIWVFNAVEQNYDYVVVVVRDDPAYNKYVTVQDLPTLLALLGQFASIKALST